MKNNSEPGRPRPRDSGLGDEPARGGGGLAAEGGSQHHGFGLLAQPRNIVFASRHAYHERMPITVELFGIPRARAGVAVVTTDGKCLGEALADLASRYPGLAESCLDGQNLRPGYTVNLRGERFVTDPETPLADGDTLLLLTLDAGG